MMRSPFEDECVLRRRACCPNWRQVSKKGELIRDPRNVVTPGVEGVPFCLLSTT